MWLKWLPRWMLSNKSTTWTSTSTSNALVSELWHFTLRLNSSLSLKNGKDRKRIVTSRAPCWNSWKNISLVSLKACHPGRHNLNSLSFSSYLCSHIDTTKMILTCKILSYPLQLFVNLCTSTANKLKRDSSIIPLSHSYSYGSVRIQKHLHLLILRIRRILTQDIQTGWPKKSHSWAKKLKSILDVLQPSLTKNLSTKRMNLWSSLGSIKLSSWKSTCFASPLSGPQETWTLPPPSPHPHLAKFPTALLKLWKKATERITIK